VARRGLRSVRIGSLSPHILDLAKGVKGINYSSRSSTGPNYRKIPVNKKNTFFNVFIDFLELLWVLKYQKRYNPKTFLILTISERLTL
jgi:hypothetical protein